MAHDNGRAVVSAPTATTIFSLPLEVRDEIWDYLVSGEYNKKGLDYRFYTNILAVNKQFHKEVTNRLYGKHAFVQISYAVRDPRGFHIDMLPVIRRSREESSVLSPASMVLAFQCHLTPRQVAPLPFGIGECRREYLLILVSDLDKFCAILSLRMQFCHRDVPIVLSNHSNGVRLTMQAGQGGWCQSTIELRSTKHKEMSIGWQTSLLEPIQRLVGANHLVELQGDVLGRGQEQLLRTVMDCKTIFVTAKKWSIFEALVVVKHLVDELILDKHQSIVLDLLPSLVVSMVKELQDGELAVDINTQSMSNIDCHITTLLLDMLVEIGWLALRIRDDYEETMHALLRSISLTQRLRSDSFRNRRPYLHRTLDSLDHLVAYCAVRLTFHGGESLKDFIDQRLHLSSHDPDPYIKHDVELLNTCPDNVSSFKVHASQK